MNHNKSHKNESHKHDEKATRENRDSAVFTDPGGDGSEIESLRLELEQANDQKLRVLAELENYRARSNRILAEERKYASIDLMRDLLSIWDNMNRAIEAAGKTHDVESLIEGVKMISNQFIDTLAKYDCRKIDAIHQPFDPNVHASISQQPSPDYPPNTVIYESQVGFKLHDRVVRPSQVVLSSGPAEPSQG